MMRKLLLLFTALAFSSIAFAQLNEGFEGATFPPDGWTNTTISGHAWQLSTSTAHGGSNSAEFEGAGYSGDNGDLITPRLDLTASGTDELTFWIQNELWSPDQNVCKVYISTDGGTSWTLLATYDTDIDAFEQKTLDLETGITQTDDAYIKFWGEDNYGYGVFIDDVAGPALFIAACPAPTAQTEINITASGADLGWTDASGSHWDIYVVATGGSAPIQGTSPTADDVTANPYTYSLGSANTSYDWYVRSDCDEDNVGTSTWTGPSTFFTGYCTPAPISVDGDGITNVTFSTVNNPTGAESGNYGDYSAMVGDVQQTVTVPIDITFETGYTYVTKIWIDWNDNLDFDDAGEEVYSGTSTSSNPTTLNASFTVPGSAALGNHRMRIGGADTGPPTPCYTGSYASYEDYTVNVTAPPACPAPIDLTETDIKLDEATLGWTENGSATTWNLEWKAGADFTPGNSEEDGSAIVNPNPTYDLTGLTPDETYYWYVQADCAAGSGTGQSSWTGSQFTTHDGKATNPTPADNATDIAVTAKTFDWDDVPGADSYTIDIGTATGLVDIVDDGTCATSTYTYTGSDWDASEDYFWTVTSVYTAKAIIVGTEWDFTTACATITSFPATEDFENAGAIPNCWTDDPANSESWLYGTSAGYGATADHTSGSGYLAWIDDSSPDNATPSNLLSPIYNTTSLTAPQLVFYYWIGRGETGSTLDVDVYDGSSWQTGQLSLSAQNGWFEVTLDLTTHTNANLRLRFSATEQVGDYDCDICIDDVTVREAPTCLAPTALTETSITIKSAALGWTESGIATTWEYEYGTSPHTFTGSGTSTTSNPVTITGLTPGTTYDWGVRADCGGDYSTWVTTGQFTTHDGKATNPVPADNATGIPLTSKTFDWDDVPGADSYTIDIGTATGLVDIVDDGACPASTYTYTGSDWDASEDYYWTVTSVYTAKDIIVGDEWAFMTECGVYTPDYTEDFTTFVPACWDEAGDGDETTGPSDIGTGLWTSSTVLGTGSAKINLYTTNRSDWLLSPDFDLSTGGYQVVVDVAVTNYNAGTPDVMGSDDAVQLLYTEDGATWTNITTWTVANALANTPTAFTFALTSTGANVQFGILATDGPIDDTEDYDFHVDKFVVETPPTCPAPSALTETDIKLDEATLGWTENGSATTWNLEWKAGADFTPGNSEEDGSAIVNPNPTYDLTGLTPDETYYWYVQADCAAGSGTGQSSWTGSQFTTHDGKATNPTPADNATDIPLTSKTFNWDDVLGADSYTIDIGTATGISDIIDDGACPASTYTYTGSDWDASEDYFWTVTTVYTAKLTVVGDEWDFMTACGSTTVPYTENFDGVTAPAVPPCMTVENTNGDDEEWKTIADGLSLPNCATIDYNSALAMNDWFFTEGLQLTGGTPYEVSFVYSAASDTYPENLAVDWGNAAVSTSMSGTPIFDEIDIDIGWYDGIGSFTPTTTGIYYVGFHGYSDADMFSLFLDDISVKEASATWIGTAKSNNWHTAGNWDINNVPGPATDVTIPASLTNYPTIGAAAVCKNITLEDGATLIGQENLTVNGTVSVEKTISGYSTGNDGWYAISAPVNGMAIAGSDFAPISGEDDFYAYDQVENIWRNFHDPVNPAEWFDYFDPTSGFLVGYDEANDGTKSFTGPFNKEASYVVNPPNANTAWSMTGNPYPSKVTWANLENTDVSSPKLMNQLTGAWDDIGTELGIGQGICVYAESSGASLTFELADQTHGAKKKETDNVANMKLKANFGDLAVQLLLLTNQNTSQAYEWRYDARYFYPATQIPYLCAISSDDIWVSKYAFKPSNETTIIPLYFKVNEAQEITFNIEDFEKSTSIDKVTLEDTHLNTFTVLTDGKAYTFTASPNDDESRFKLHLETSTGISENSAIEGLNIYTYDKTLYLNSKRILDAQLSIFNITGQEMMRRKVRLDGLKQFEMNVNTGWYMVKVITDEGISSRKVFIR